jgi:hypothetical protein
MNVPAGDLRRSRVVADAAVPLEAALDRRLTGYLALRPADPLAPDDSGGIITVEDGVPVVAYHDGTDRGGTAALAPLSESGPYRAELYAAEVDGLAAVHEVEALRVAPGSPAEQVADAPDLARRTRERAPAARLSAEGDDAVEAFLADEERIADIKRRARAEAERRASEWGFDDAVDAGER